MAVLEETKYKKIFNIVESAGITNTDMTDVNNAIDVYDKIANWVNAEQWLNDIFKAEVVTVTEDSRYRVQLNCKTTGASITYGYASANASNNGNSTSPSYRYNNYTYGGIVPKTSIPVERLKLIVIKSKYGFIADFFDSNVSSAYGIGFLATRGIDNSGIEIPITFIYYEGYRLYICKSLTDNLNCSTWGIHRNLSKNTGLFTFMVPDTDVICEHVKMVNGVQISNQTFFEAGNRTWVTICTSADYKGLALEIE